MFFSLASLIFEACQTTLFLIATQCLASTGPSNQIKNKVKMVNCSIECLADLFSDKPNRNGSVTFQSTLIYAH